jgi:phage FluMu gp28-like protein
VPGHTLTCSPGGWSGATGFTFAWIRDGSVTVGAGSTYTVTAAEVHHRIACHVQATGAGGSVPAESAAVTVAPLAITTFIIHLKAARATLAALRARGERVLVSVPQPCKITLRLLAVRLSHGRPLVKVLGLKRVSFARRGSKQITLGLSQAALRGLKGKFILRIAAMGTSGASQSQPASITIAG